LWKFNLSVFLRSKRLLKIVEGTLTEKDFKKEDDWDEQNSAAMVYITCTIEPKYLRLLVACQTAHEMWMKMAMIFEQHAAENKYLLQQKFFEGDWNQSVRNGTHLRAQKPENLNPEAIKYKITSWQNRAEMATKQGNQDLAREALKQISEYEKLLLDGDSNGNTKPRDFES